MPDPRLNMSEPELEDILRGNEQRYEERGEGDPLEAARWWDSTVRELVAQVRLLNRRAAPPES